MENLLKSADIVNKSYRDYHKIFENAALIKRSNLTVESSDEPTSYLMFYIPRRIMGSFSGGFLVSTSLLGTDLEYLIKILIFNSLKFKLIWN